jgi:hypothetical protein
MPLNLTGCGVVTACTIDMAGAATSPSTAGSNYGMFGYSGVGLGISSTASGPNQGIAIFTCGDFERMRIVSSGNVGIGTTTPCSALHVASGANTNGLFVSKIASCTNKQGIFIAADDSAGAYIAGGTSPNGTALQTDGFGRLILQNGAEEGFQFQTSAVTGGSAQSWNTRMVIKNNGNVGIGTTTPLNLLHVCGNPSSAGLVARFQSTSTSGSISISHSGNGGNVGYANIGAGNAANTFYITTGAGTIGSGITMNNGGNVGIGTCTPGEKLVVDGGQGVIQLRVDSSDGSTINVRPDAGRCGWVSFTEDAVADRWGIGIKNGDSKLYFSSGNVASGGGTTRMVLDSSGNMGIGVEAPASNIRLQICDANAAGVDDMVRLMQCLPGNHAFYRSQRCGGATMIMGPTRNSADGCIPSESAIVWTTTNNPLSFGTCGRDRMRIATDGNVVVGGTSANIVGFTGTVLTVNGGGNYQGYEVSTSNVTRMTMVSDGNNGYLSTRVAGMCLIFETGAASEKMRITSGGCIGVGITSPSYLLHVNGTFYAAGSSIDYKEGICDYDTNSCLFMCLKPKTYQYKDEWKHLGKELKSETQIGLIAEEVAEVMPELAVLVNEDDNKVVRNVDYEKLSIVLLSEVQKLRTEIDQLKNIYTKQQ